MKSTLNLEMFKVVIFDLDGTLYNSKNAWIKTEKEIAKHLKVPLPKKELQYQLFGKSAKVRLKTLFPKRQKVAKKLFFGKERRGFLSEFKLFKDTKRLLRHLKNKNIKIAIATGLDRKALNILFTKDKLWQFIDIALTSEEVKKEKPDPEILLQILKNLQLKPRETLYIGDAIFDIEAAKRAKIKVLIITRGAISNQKTAKELGADYVFSNFAEFLQTVKNHP